MSVRPRPSMRSPSLMIRSRTSFLVSERIAAPISFSRPAQDSPSLSVASALHPVRLRLAVGLGHDRQRLGELVGDLAGHGLVHVLGVLDEHRVLAHRDGAGGLGGEPLLRLAQDLDEGLGGFQALGHGVLGGRHRAAGLIGEQLERLRGRLGLDHHDGHVTVLEHPASDHHVEGGVRQLLVRREGHPLVLDQRDPHPADGAGERQPGQLGGHGRGVDRHHVVQVLRVEGQDRLDDLDLVAQALDERRAQRPVDEPAGEDRVLGRTALPAEERAWDPARRVHPLLHVHGEREEVQAFLRRPGRRGRREDHGFAVENHQGRTGCLAG